MNSHELSVPLDLYADAQCAIFVVGPRARVLWLNTRAAQMTGYGKEELTGHPMSDLLSPFPWYQVSPQFSRAFEQGEPYRYRGTLAARDRTRIEVEVFARPVEWTRDESAILVRTRDIRSECALRRSLRSELRRAAFLEERERKRAARLVHDDILNSLLDMSTLIRELKSLEPCDGTALDETVFRLETQLESSIEAVRKVARRLRENASSEVDLPTALRDLTKYQLPSMPAIDLSIHGEDCGLSKEANYLILGAAQEALRNAERHSQATGISVALCIGEECLRLTVRDNGIGFSAPADAEEAASRGSLGLLGLYERAALLGGTVRIHSEPGGGTSIELVLPRYCACD